MLQNPLGLLYARRPVLAIVFGVASLALGIAGFVGLLRGPWTVPGLSIGLWLAGVILAYRSAKQVANVTPQGAAPWYARWYGLAGIAALVILAIGLFRVFLYEPFKMPSSSMEPSVPVDARIIVQKHGFGHLSTVGLKLGKLPASAPLRRGDIIAFDYPRDPSQTYVKRVIGLPGDQLIYRGKAVIVNGLATRTLAIMDDITDDITDDIKPGSESKSESELQQHLNRLGDVTFLTLADPARPPATDSAWKFPMSERCVQRADAVQCDVPAGHYFVMGDNRDNSADSRYWGFVRADQVIGKVVRVFTPTPLSR